MNQNGPVSRSAVALPALVAASGGNAGIRFLEFFAAQIRNPHTRRAYGRAVGEFLAWCESVGGTSVRPLHVAGWIDRADGLQLRPHRRRAGHEGRGRLHAELPVLSVLT